MTLSTRDPLVAISLLAGVGFTATAEYELARTIGAVPAVAVLLPLALDVYVVAAIRRSRGRDIALSLVLMGTAQVAAHMLTAHVVAVSVPLVAAVSLLVPLSIWRVHALAVLPAARKQEEDGSETAAASAPTAEAEVAPDPIPEAAAEAEAPEEPMHPELHAVPEPAMRAEAKPRPAPARRQQRKRPQRKKAARKSSPAGSSPAFEQHVASARAWLAEEGDLSGKAIGDRLRTSDRYGRMVKTAALDAASASDPGQERPMEGGYA